MSTARNHSARRFWLAVFLLFAVWILVSFTGCADRCETYYRLPDGALCRSKTDGNGPRILFRCDTRREYVNPEWYQEEQVCK